MQSVIAHGSARAKLLMSKYKITDIIYIHTGMNNMRISTQNIACSQRQMYTCIHHSERERELNNSDGNGTNGDV